LLERQKLQQKQLTDYFVIKKEQLLQYEKLADQDHSSKKAALVTQQQQELRPLVKETFEEKLRLLQKLVEERKQLLVECQKKLEAYLNQQTLIPMDQKNTFLAGHLDALKLAQETADADMNAQVTEATGERDMKENELVQVEKLQNKELQDEKATVTTKLKELKEQFLQEQFSKHDKIITEQHDDHINLLNQHFTKLQASFAQINQEAEQLLSQHHAAQTELLNQQSQNPAVRLDWDNLGKQLTENQQIEMKAFLKEQEDELSFLQAAITEKIESCQSAAAQQKQKLEEFNQQCFVDGYPELNLYGLQLEQQV